MEWDDLIEAIRQDKPYNEAKRGAEGSLNCEHEMAPDVDKFTMDSPAPVQLQADGRYPVPMPGLNTKREY